jgi:putative transposase
MAAADIEGLRGAKLRKTTTSDPAATRHPELVERAFSAEAPRQLWVSDLT